MSNTRIDWKRQPAYATGDGNYTRLYYHDGTHLLVTVTLRVILMGFPALIRIHKQCAIDPAYVKGWTRDRTVKEMRIYLNDGNVVKVSRRRQKEVVELLKQFKQEPARV